MSFTIPPLILGAAALSYPWPTSLLGQLQSHPAETLPVIFRYITPPLIGIGLGAIIAAVTSRFSASILSAGSMFTWNCIHRLPWPDLSGARMKRLIRLSIILLGAGAALMAFKVQSVQALWFFSDLIFVLLFPQLILALLDPKANRTGSIPAFSVSLILRLGGGEPLLHIPPLIPYPELLAGFVPLHSKDGGARLPARCCSPIKGWRR